MDWRQVTFKNNTFLGRVRKKVNSHGVLCGNSRLRRDVRDKQKKRMIKPIKTERDYNRALKRIEELWYARKNTPEEDELEVLVALVQVYDQEHYPVPPPTLQQAVEFYMDQHGLTRTDLAKMLGGKSRVSELLSGKRTPSVRMMKVLHRELGIPAELLLGD